MLISSDGAVGTLKLGGLVGPMVGRGVGAGVGRGVGLGVGRGVGAGVGFGLGMAMVAVRKETILQERIWRSRTEFCF